MADYPVLTVGGRFSNTLSVVRVDVSRTKLKYVPPPGRLVRTQIQALAGWGEGAGVGGLGGGGGGGQTDRQTDR